MLHSQLGRADLAPLSVEGPQPRPDGSKIRFLADASDKNPSRAAALEVADVMLLKQRERDLRILLSQSHATLAEIAEIEANR